MNPIRVEKAETTLMAAPHELRIGEAIDIGMHIIYCNRPGMCISFPKHPNLESNSLPSRTFGEGKYPRVPSGTRIVITVE